MKFKNIWAVMLFVVIGLSACSDSTTSVNKTDDQTVEKDKQKPVKHMLSDQEKMLQKAKDTEKLVQEADEKRRRALKDQGG